MFGSSLKVCHSVHFAHWTLPFLESAIHPPSGTHTSTFPCVSLLYFTEGPVAALKLLPISQAQANFIRSILRMLLAWVRGVPSQLAPAAHSQLLSVFIAMATVPQ